MQGLKLITPSKKAEGVSLSAEEEIGKESGYQKVNVDMISLQFLKLFDQGYDQLSVLTIVKHLIHIIKKNNSCAFSFDVTL